MKHLLLLPLLALTVVAHVALSSDYQLPCDTSYATHEVFEAGMEVEIECFDSLAAAQAAYASLAQAPDEFANRILEAAFAYINANYFTNVTCGPCYDPDLCQKRVGSYGEAILYGHGIQETSPGRFCLVTWPLSDLELSMSCLPCAE